MSQPYNLFSYVHKGNTVVEFITGVNGMLLNIIADIEQELLNISIKTTSREMCETFRNIFGSRDVFENKVERAMIMLKEAKVTQEEYPKLYEKLDQMMHAHEESKDIMGRCVEVIRESKLPDDEKDDLINMFRDAELHTKELDPSKLWPDTAKALHKLFDKKRGDRDKVLEALEKIGEKHLKNHTMRKGTKEIIAFINRSSLPKDEKVKLIEVFKTSYVKDAPLQQNTYKKLLQLMKDKGLVYDSRNRKGMGYINEDIRILVSTSGEYHVLYPEEYTDVFEGIPGKDGKRHGGLLLEAAIRSGERSEYSVTQLRSVAITQEKVNGLMEDNVGQNSIFKLRGLPAALTEKVIRENQKKSRLILAREESAETKGKALPFNKRKYDLYIIAGDSNEKKDRNYSELVRLMTIGAYMTTGYVGQQYEGPRMTVNMKEHLAATNAIESVGEKETQKGYLMPVIKAKVHDPVTGNNKDILRAGTYLHFDKHTISEMNEDQTLKKQVHFKSEDSMKNALYLNYKGGTGEKVFIPEQEYNSIMTKVPAIKKMITQAMGDEAKADIEKYVSDEMSRIEKKTKEGYKSEKSENNDRKKYELLGKIKESMKSDDKKTVVSAVLYGTNLKYLDESARGHFEKNDAKESGNKNLAKDTAIAREVLLSTEGKINNTDIFNRIMAHNLTENHTFRKKPDEISVEQTDFLYHEISRMEKNGAFNLTAPYVDRDGNINGKLVTETIKNALSEIRATVKNPNEIEKEVAEKMERNAYGHNYQTELRRQEAAAFEYASYMIEQAEPDGEARDGELDISETKELIKRLHDSIDAHVTESNQILEGSTVEYEKTEDSMDYNEVDYKASVKKMKMVSSIEDGLSDVDIIRNNIHDEPETKRGDEIDFER